MKTSINTGNALGVCVTESLSGAARAIRVSRGTNPQSTAWFPRVSNEGSRGWNRRDARIKTLPTPRFLWRRLIGACATESPSGVARTFRVSRGANSESTAWFPRVSYEESREKNRHNTGIYASQTPRFLLRRLLALVALCLLPLGIVGCGGGDESSDSAAPAVAPELTKAEREANAQAMYSKAQVAMLDDKIIEMDRVANIYWDTSSGPLAHRDLIFYLLDRHIDDPEKALEELKSFNQRHPNHKELMTACVILGNALIKVLNDEDTEDPKRELREKISKEAVKIWVEVGGRLAEREEFASEFELHLELGNAYLYAAKPLEAEAAMARVESFPEPAAPQSRYRVLVQRAYLWLHSLNNPQRALELFKKAESLDEQIGTLVGENVRDDVTARIREIEEGG